MNIMGSVVSPSSTQSASEVKALAVEGEGELDSKGSEKLRTEK